MTLEETVLGDSSSLKLAVALGVFIVSAPAFSHGHHSHGKPLTEVEQKAANGVFDDANVQNRKLSGLGWSLAIRLSFTAKWQT